MAKGNFHNSTFITFSCITRFAIYIQDEKGFFWATERYDEESVKDKVICVVVECCMNLRSESGFHLLFSK
jgi:hypothetical protein